MQVTTRAGAAERVVDALKGAAEATGASFDYLMQTAKRESSLNPSASAATSSAKGLFQFIEQTWLQAMKEDGPKLGLADQAADISRTASGRYTVADPQRKAELLSLRDDPQAAALLAGAFTKRNAETLQSALGRGATEGELYAAHFLGARGAVDLVTLAANTPNASAASAFPAQAAANRAIFYDKGRPRSASEVYARVTASHDATSGVASVAAAPTGRTAVALQSAGEDAAYGPFNGGVENDREAFHSLFKTGRRSPVSSYVSQAWSSFGSAGLASDVAAARRTASAKTVATVATVAAATPVSAKATVASRVADAFALTTRRAAAASAQTTGAVKNTDVAAAVRSAATLDLARFRKADVTPPSPSPSAYRIARR